MYDETGYKPTTRSGRDDITNPRQNSNPRSRAEKRVIGDYLSAGHGVHVVVVPEWKPVETLACRYCGTELLTPHEETPCEFPDQPMQGCECNGCVIREGKLKRKAGRTREVCSSTECRKAHNRARQAESRARKKACAA